VLSQDTKDAPAEPPAAEPDVPPIARRVLGVFVEPVATFRSLDAAWGILGPWLIILGAGLLYAGFHFVLGDAKLLASAKQAYVEAQYTGQMRRMAAQADSAVDPGKAGAFATSVGLLLGPTVGSILSIVVVGTILFGAAAAFGGKKDLLRAMVVAAHAKVVAVAGYAVCALALVFGNPSPTTSLMNLADEVAKPVQCVALAIVDPIAIWHTGLLAIGLTVSLGVKRPKAIAVAVALLLLPWLLGLGGASVAAAFQGMKKG
jgi:hypothetical protein